MSALVAMDVTEKASKSAMTQCLAAIGTQADSVDEKEAAWYPELCEFAVAAREDSRLRRWARHVLECAQKARAARPGLLTGPGLKCVHVSDTHNRHRRLRIGEGDVLIHTGDLCANYGDGADLEAQLLDAARWFGELRFRFIAVIAGNHDTPLVRPSFKRRFLKALPSHARYLENEGVTFEGVTFFGTPACVCRRELLGKRYYSDAFETPSKARAELFDRIPDNVDVLMTHPPPRSVLGSRVGSCKILAAAISAKKPRVHCFGHDHDYFGLDAGDDRSSTLSLNAAQESIVRAQLKAGRKTHLGLPLVFYIRPRTDYDTIMVDVEPVVPDAGRGNATQWKHRTKGAASPARCRPS